MAAKTIMNSSPPILAKVSALRIRERKRSATWPSSVSPYVARPRLSFTNFKAVQINVKEERHDLIASLGGSQGLPTAGQVSNLRFGSPV